LLARAIWFILFVGQCNGIQTLQCGLHVRLLWFTKNIFEPTISVNKKVQRQNPLMKKINN